MQLADVCVTGESTLTSVLTSVIYEMQWFGVKVEPIQKKAKKHTVKHSRQSFTLVVQYSMFLQYIRVLLSLIVVANLLYTRKNSEKP
jgi:hypothetical protein